MTIDKFDYTWAESGSLGTTPTDEKIQEGWVSGERPKHERFNLLQDRVEKKLNKIQREGLDSFYRDATDPQKMIMTGLWNESWGTMADSDNIISGGATKKYKSFASFFDANNDPRLIIADDTAGKFEVWDPRAMSLLDTSDVWSDDLPSGSGQTWECYSIITDGTYVYAAFTDTNASPDTHQIQAWNISTWDPHSGWAATGTALPGTGSLPAPGSQIIFASSTKIATANGWNTISSSASAAISIIDITDGSIDASGAGDANAGGTDFAYDLCSDGTNVFFITDLGADQWICSCTIADPTTGSGGTNFPLQETTSSAAHVVACGPNLMIALFEGHTTQGDNVIRSFNATDADLDIINRGQNSFGTPVGDEDYIFTNPKWACFDGLNLWILGTLTIGATSSMSLTKIDVAKFPQIDTSIERSLNDVTTCSFIVAPDTESWSIGRCVFDGRDIWCLIEDTASATNSGKLFRLPLALYRN